MSPPPNFPYHYGMVGPLLHVNATAPVNINHNGSAGVSPATEMTVVTNSDETIRTDKDGTNDAQNPFMK